MQPDLTADTAAAKPALKLRAGISPAGFVMIMANRAWTVSVEFLRVYDLLKESTSTNDRRPLHNARTQGHVDIQIDSDIEC